MDAALILYNAGGKELVRSRGLLDFAAPADGEYHLKVYDFLFRGGGEYFYRLAVNTGPHIDFIFPPSGLAGTKGKYLLYGRNLPGSNPAKDLAVDGKPLEQLEVEIELAGEPAAQKQLSSLQQLADATLDAFEYRLNTTHGVSNPVLLSFAAAPVVAEEKPQRKPVKKPAYAVESAKPEDAPEAEGDEALAVVEGEEEPAVADEDETFLEEEEEDGPDVTGIIGGPVAEPDEPQ